MNDWKLQPLSVPSEKEMQGQQELFIDSKNNVYDVYVEEEHNIIDESGNAADDLEIMAGGHLNYNALQILQKEENAEIYLSKLLELQSNKNPLKKGGKKIGYRSDLFIFNYRQKLSIGENFVFDIISGVISSQPDNLSYDIYTDDVTKLFPTMDARAVQRYINEGIETFQKNNHLDFEFEYGSNKKATLTIPWYKTFVKIEDIDTGEIYGFEITPEPLFKALMISSGVVHGSHFPIEIPTYLKGHTRTLYYFLESMKKYRAYPDAREGVFEIFYDELCAYFGINDETYKMFHFEQRILEKGKQIFENIPDCDITFSYEKGKKVDKTVNKKKYYYRFNIQQILPERVQKKIQDNEQALLDTAEAQMLKGLNLKDNEVIKIVKKYKETGRDIAFLSQAIFTVLTDTTVKNKASVICYKLEHGLESKMQTKKTNNSKSHALENQREYNYEDLMEKLRSN